MKQALFTLLLVFPVWLVAQPDTLNTREEMIFSDPEAPGYFPGGHAAMKQFLAENLVLPPELHDPHAITVRVWVRFYLSETGKISQISAERTKPECAACETEALRVVQLMPDWIPGSVNGKPTAMWYQLPIKFDPLQ